MKKYLVGVDGSDQSIHAIRKAAELATATNARLVLAYARMPMTHLADIYAGSLTDLEEVDRQHGEDILRDAARMARYTGCLVDSVMLQGHPATALAEQATRDNDIDLVVVGSRGLGAMASAILGSVTDRLVRMCKKPVLVVH